MAYNLRSRVQHALMRDEQDDIGGNGSSEEDNVSIQTNTSTSSSDYSEADDIANITDNQRMFQQRNRTAGRPATILRSKNKRKWSVTLRSRTSG